jgi:hypothetical protein
LESYFASFLEADLEKIGSIFGAYLEHISCAYLELFWSIFLGQIWSLFSRYVNYALTPLKIVVVFSEKSIVVFS